MIKAAQTRRLHMITCLSGTKMNQAKFSPQKNPLRFESKAESAWRIADLRLGICIACVAGPQFYGGPDLQRACHAG